MRTVPVILAVILVIGMASVAAAECAWVLSDPLIRFGPA